MEPNTLNFMPRIGDQAPDFEALTTLGKLRFSEYAKGTWTILFSHPADFTPVCTTEMSGFAQEKDFFAAHDTKLMGLSIDSIHSHICPAPPHTPSHSSKRGRCHHHWRAH